MELILVRHGLPQRVINQNGQPANPSLSDVGHQQAQKVAAWLQHESIDRLYSSPMKRAKETADPIATCCTLDVEIRDGVAEYDQHSQHYIPIEELKALDFERWQRVMGGEMDSVDFPRFADTVVDTLESIVAENRGGRAAVICHGGVINVWSAHVMGFTPRVFFNPNYTSINRFMVASSGVKSVLTLNEHAHLTR